MTIDYILKKLGKTHDGRDYHFNFSTKEKANVRFYHDDWNRYTKEYANLNSIYYPGCGWDIAPLFGNFSKLIFQDKGGSWFDCYPQSLFGHFKDVPPKSKPVSVNKYWEEIMTMLEKKDLITLIEVHKGNPDYYKFSTGKEKELFLYYDHLGDVKKSIPQDVKEAELVLGRGMAVTLELVPFIKVGAIVDVSGYNFCDPWYWYAPEDTNLEPIGIKRTSKTTWTKFRQVDKAAVDNFVEKLGVYNWETGKWSKGNDDSILINAMR